MHPTADTIVLKFLQRCVAAGDAGQLGGSLETRHGVNNVARRIL
jgi:hypothetical protein